MISWEALQLQNLPSPISQFLKECWEFTFFICRVGDLGHTQLCSGITPRGVQEDHMCFAREWIRVSQIQSKYLNPELSQPRNSYFLKAHKRSGLYLKELCPLLACKDPRAPINVTLEASGRTLSEVRLSGRQLGQISPWVTSTGPKQCREDLPKKKIKRPQSTSTGQLLQTTVLTYPWKPSDHYTKRALHWGVAQW